MFLYFYLLDQALFSEVLRPALARSRRARSFDPCRDLCARLVTQNKDIPQDALIRAVLGGLAFDRALWHALVGECLVHGATDIPRLQTAPEALTCLLAPEHYGRKDIARDQYVPIEQAHFGARDLVFGDGYYRPDHAGLNDTDDVSRLTAYLEAVDPNAWSVRDLDRLTDLHVNERAEELAYVRDWWPSLVKLYQKARDRRLLVACECV